MNASRRRQPSSRPRRGSVRRPAPAEFLRGLLAPSLLALLVGLACAGTALALLHHAVVSGEFLAVPEGNLLIYEHDDAMHETYLLADLRRDPPRGDVVYFVGGSKVLEMVESPESIAAELRRVSGRDIEVYLLGSCGQSFADDLAIVDSLPPSDGRGLVVVAVDYRRFVFDETHLDRTVSHGPILVESRALREIVGRRVWWARYTDLLLPRVLRQLSTWAFYNEGGILRGRLPRHEYVQHRFQTFETSVRMEDRRAHLEWIAGTGSERLASNAAYNEELLRALVATARAKGLRVVLLETPRDIGLIGDRWDAVVAQERAICADLASETGVSYVDFVSQAGLETRDFADLFHLLPSGRAKWEPLLAEHLQPDLRTLEGP